MSRKLSDAEKSLNKLIHERARLAMQESLLGTRFDLVKNRIREVDAAIKDANAALINGGNGGHNRLNDNEKEMCRNHEKLGAIKAIRERLNLGLKEAKDAVLHYCEQNNLVTREN